MRGLLYGYEPVAVYCLMTRVSSQGIISNAEYCSQMPGKSEPTKTCEMNDARDCALGVRDPIDENDGTYGGIKTRLNLRFKGL